MYLFLFLCSRSNVFYKRQRSKRVSSDAENGCRGLVEETRYHVCNKQVSRYSNYLLYTRVPPPTPYLALRLSLSSYIKLITGYNNVGPHVDVIYVYQVVTVGCNYNGERRRTEKKKSYFFVFFFEKTASNLFIYE